MCLPLCDLASVNVLRQGPAGSVQVDIHEKRQAKKTTNKREPLHPHLQPAALAAAVSSTVALAEPADLPHSQTFFCPQSPPMQPLHTTLNTRPGSWMHRDMLLWCACRHQRQRR